MHQTIFKVAIFHFLLLAGKCSQDEPGISHNSLDKDNVMNSVSATCGPSGFKCAGTKIYQTCSHNEGKQKVSFCPSGTVCEDTGLEICIPEPPPCQQEGGFLLPGSCNKFYLCIRTGSKIKRYVGSCEPGFEFNITTGNCTLPFDADCSVKKIISTDARNPPKNIFSRIDEVGEDRFVCKSAGLFADPSSCRHYFMCVRNWFPILGGKLLASRLQCPQILPHYDPVKKLCWFFSDDCSAKKT